MFFGRGNLAVELDKKCFNVDDLIEEVIKKMDIDQKKCIVVSKSSVPMINVDGIDYWVIIRSVFGAFIGTQTAVLKKVKSPK
ncbi:MAG: hypothetical protein CVU84_05995 [Firmicutes bacterium HGW-Firmicutes-1]|nr:MAG: hypothetical protein CVU84_05995 [Firmicutes bacterium HGW-Firmicutes-1]